MTNSIIIKGVNIMKKIAILVTIVVFGVITTAGSGHAGHRGHHHGGLLEGVIIGAGAAILGTAIISGITPPPRYERIYVNDGYDSDDEWYDRCDRGRWSVERVWVEPVYKERWIPGHYSRRGYWIPGRYHCVMIREGYWETRRVWVRN